MKLFKAIRSAPDISLRQYHFYSLSLTFQGFLFCQLFFSQSEAYCLSSSSAAPPPLPPTMLRVVDSGMPYQMVPSPFPGLPQAFSSGLLSKRCALALMCASQAPRGCHRAVVGVCEGGVCEQVQPEFGCEIGCPQNLTWCLIIQPKSCYRKETNYQSFQELCITKAV